MFMSTIGSSLLNRVTQVVLADGSTVNANEYSHRDLFWALKGGSNNFGTINPCAAEPPTSADKIKTKAL